MTSLLIPMAVFALVTSISPGPVNIIATVTGANHGYARTVPHIIGATLGFVSILFLFGLSLSLMMIEISNLAKEVTYVGGSFLLYLAYKVATQEPSINNEECKGSRTAPSLLQGIMCQWLNPKAWIVSLAGISVFYTGHDAGIWMLSLFCVIFFVVCYISISVWAKLGVAISAILETPKQFRLFNVFMALLLALTVIYTFFLSS
ncbi:LysE family translocator [Vibrio sp. LaRot3]|uniref:LysE family translocator n=1 Tax=Vibrio sp. LaRot3 TaxID=2998829 RepID=UPI0022CDC061|nr:LysE family translocator [Vibrio sp. LaRot3]MDA0148288.1 LysE family translocator [Vibrio sp. LaRot3]